MDSGKRSPEKAMKLFSTHIPFEKLADIAEGRADAAEHDALMPHLSSCSDCSRELHRLEQAIALMRSDKSEDAPRDVLSSAINIFRPKSAEAEPSLLRRLVATLTFDSLTVAPAFGVRSGQAQSRQLLYSAEDNDIDLRITLQNNEWVVAGQVLRADCFGGQVEMQGTAGSIMVPLNDVCEFTLPAVPRGEYLLRVKMSDVEVEVPRLELG